MTVSFRLFLLCSFVLLARPQDILPFLQPIRPALVLTILATAALVFSSRRQELTAALSQSESKRYLLFFFIMVLGIPFAYYRAIAFDGVLQRYLVNVLFFVLLVSQITSLPRLTSLVWVICLAALAYGVFGGILQGGNLGGGRFQVLGGVFDPNDTAYVLLALFPLCLYFIQFDKGLMKRLVAVIAICGAIATILLTGSRGGILGFGTVLLLMLMTRMCSIGKGQKMALALAVVFASTWLLMKDKVDVQRYLTISNISSDYNITDSGGRVALWSEAIDLILANPITGVGVDCYATANHQARLLRGATYFRWHAVHNSFLQIAAEVGLVGFAIFALICVRSFATFLRSSRAQLPLRSGESSEVRALGGLMFIGFTGLLVSGFFLSQGYSIFFTLYFALAAAMGRLHAGASTLVAAK